MHSGTIARRIAVHFCPVFEVISTTSCFTYASNSGVPATASVPSTEALIESVSLVNRTPPVCTESFARSFSAVDAEPVKATRSPRRRWSNRSGTLPDTSCSDPVGQQARLDEDAHERLGEVAGRASRASRASARRRGTPGANFSSDPHTGKLKALICTATPGRRV